jgi:hypothetical protein
MPIFVNCVCGKRLQGRDEDAGRPTKCPFCGQILTLPAAEAAPPLELDPWRSPSVPSPAPPPPPAPAPAPQPVAAAGYVCRVCGRSFGGHEVYSEGSTVICKRCFEASAPRTPEPLPEPSPIPSGRDRWDHIKLPGSRRRERRYDDEEDDIVRPRARHIHNYMTESILCTLFCCLPFGVVAIVKASQVDSMMRMGDYRGAAEAADAAKTWCGVSFGLGLASAVIWALVLISAGGRL